MDYFERLVAALPALLNNSAQNAEFLLQQALEDAKPRLLNLLHLNPRNSSEKAEVESGKITLNGKPTLFNDEFKKETLFLAQELDCSERYCAQLLDHVVRNSPNVSGSGISESALILHHTERASLLTCLRTILESASNQELEPRLVALLQRYTIDIIGHQYDLGGQKGKGPLASKTLAEIDALKQVIAKQRVVLQSTNAPPQTYSWQQPAAPTAPTFSSATISARIAWLQGERQQFGHILYILGAGEELKGPQIMTAVKWLSKVDDLEEGLTLYVLTAVFAAFAADSGDSTGPHKSIYQDGELVTGMDAAMKPNNWTNKKLRAALLLQHSLFLLEVRNSDPHLLGEYIVVDDEVTKVLKEAIRADAFQALTLFILRSRGPETTGTVPEFHIGPDDSIASGPAARWDHAQHADSVQPEFRAYLLQAFETILLLLIKKMSRVFRDVRKQEEDFSLSWMRSSRANPAHGPAGSAEPPKPVRHDIESFFRAIAVIYDEADEDAALRFWVDDEEGRLFPFLKWAGESTQAGMVVAMYDMFASLARGKNCAAYAYNFFSSAGGQYAPTGAASNYPSSCSWSTLFLALHHYESKMPHPRTMQAPSPTQSVGVSGPSMSQTMDAPRFALPPEEILMLSSFLRLLRNVAKYSLQARIALHENTDFRAIQSLFNLTAYAIPLELKAMLFDTLAAFGGPGGGTIGSEMVHQMWTVLEKMEIIPVRGAVGNTMFSSRIGRPVGGAVVELEQVETAGKTYPATISFLNLLNSLIHTPGKALTLRRGFEIESHTIPENLGAGYRFPGLKPYVDFVIDKVFLRAFEREYTFPLEQWRVLEACYCFIEKSLASFDLSILQGDEFSPANLANPAAGTRAANTLATLATHPGFLILKQILGLPALRQNVLYVVDQGFAVAFANLGRGHLVYKTVLRSLRIIYRVFQIQGLFIEGLVPLLNEVGELPGVGLVGFPSSSIAPLDQSMLHNPNTAAQLAMYVTASQPELALMAVKIIIELGDSPYFNTVHQMVNGYPVRTVNPLVASIREYPEYERILAGFVNWLATDAVEDEDPSDESFEAVVTGSQGGTPPLTQAIRVAILQLFLQNTQQGRPAPNIAHLLLGFDTQPSGGEMTLEDPHAANSRRSCLHTVLDLLGEGISKDREGQASGIPLFKTHPALAERCYQLVYQLCTHNYTSTPVIRYLRSREHFFLHQLSAIPMKAPELHRGIVGQALYTDRAVVETTSSALTSFLRLRSWVLEAVALELHVLTETNQFSRAERLLEVLFGRDRVDASYALDTEGELYADAPGQTLIRILEIFDSLAIEWRDSLSPKEIPLALYGSINWDACLQTDAHGCVVYDFRFLLSALSSARRDLSRQGALNAHNVQEQLKLETDFILQSAALDNHRREIEHAKSTAFASWAKILNISVIKCFDRLPHERREGILYELLHAVPPAIMTLPTSGPTAVVLAETLVSLISKLREDQRRQDVLQQRATEGFNASLPVDRLHNLLKSVLECVLRQGTNERVRGNLYTVLIHFIHLALEPTNSRQTVDDGSSSLKTSIGGDRERSQGGLPKLSSLASGTLNIVNIVVDRLVPLVCLDAIDGSEVWKTVAFTFLDILIRLSRNDRSNRVLGVMSKNGYLQNFVHSLRESGPDLERMLKPDPPSLNSLYVYEAKMSVLIRIAQTRHGADRLLEAKMFPILASCEFIGARPNTDDDYMDQDAFLPTALERYHQILLPVLQLAVSCLSTIGATVPTVTKQALSFVYAHRETLSGLLGENPTTLSFAVLREYQMIVALCTFVLPQVKPEDLFDLAAWKPIHAAILSLGAKCMNHQRWNAGVVAVNATEQVEATQRATGYGEAGNAFGTKISSTVRLLQRWVIAYLATFSESETDGFKPALGPTSLRLDAENQNPSQQGQAKAPTVSDAVAALKQLVSDASQTLAQISDISLKLENIDRVPAEEIDEIAQRSKTDFGSEDLDLEQKKGVAFFELEHALDRRRHELLELLHSVELLLFLAWRHLSFYFQPLRPPGSKAATTLALKSLGAAFAFGDDATNMSLKVNVANGINAALDIIDSDAFDLEQVLGHEGASSRFAYFRLLSRQLRELVAVRDGDWEMVNE